MRFRAHADVRLNKVLPQGYKLQAKVTVKARIGHAVNALGRASPGAFR